MGAVRNSWLSKCALPSSFCSSRGKASRSVGALKLTGEPKIVIWHTAYGPFFFVVGRLCSFGMTVSHALSLSPLAVLRREAGRQTN